MGLKNDVRSKPGVGSIFSVEVPLSTDSITVVDSTTTNEELIESDTQHVDLHTDLTDKVVLYIDDDINILHAVDMLLSDKGIEMIGVADADELHEVLSDQQLVIDAAIVDYNIEDDFTGIDAIEIIKEMKGKDIPVLVVTAETDDEVLERIKNSGSERLLKPIENGALIKWLKENT